MRPNLLVLGGTTEATALCRALAEHEIPGAISFAGRVDRPVRQPLPQRVGGFGGADGLAEYLRTRRVTHLVDATHPFAASMSQNAVAASAMTGVPLIALTRAPWHAAPGDNWTRAADMSSAVTALNRSPMRVMLAIGRMHLDLFAPNPQHFYLLRLVDPPKTPPPFSDYEVIVDRGPFSEAKDFALMQDYRINMVVSKNAGGSGAYAKIAAARRLDLPVVMIDRPVLPARTEAHSIAEVLNWIHHVGVTERGV